MPAACPRSLVSTCQKVPRKHFAIQSFQQIKRGSQLRGLAGGADWWPNGWRWCGPRAWREEGAVGGGVRDATSLLALVQKTLSWVSL